MSPYSTATKLWCPWHPATVPLRHLRLVGLAHHNWSLQSTSGGTTQTQFVLNQVRQDAKKQQGIYWVLHVYDLCRWKEVHLKWKVLNICLETFIYRYLKAPLQKMSFFVSKIWNVQKIRFQKHQTFEQLLLWSQLPAQLLCFGAMDFVVPSAGRCAGL